MLAKLCAWHKACCTQKTQPSRDGPLFRGESDFDDHSWNLDAPPTGVEAPGLLQPPLRVTRHAAVERIRSSAKRLSTLLEQLTPEHGSEMCVQVPWATISLYQLVERAGGHTLRHVAR
jgi:hypothetical protein